MPPASPQPKIFLSIVKHDLGSQRKAVEDHMRQLGATVLVPADQVPPVARLHDTASLLAGADAVVMVVGQCAGEGPPQDALQAVLQQWDNQSPGLLQRLGVGAGAWLSYSQLEARIAFVLGKPVHVMMLSDAFPYDPHAPEAPALQQSQAEHRRILAGAFPGNLLHQPSDLQQAVRHLPCFPKPLEAIKAALAVVPQSLEDTKPVESAMPVAAPKPKRRLAHTLAMIFAVGFVVSGVWHIATKGSASPSNGNGPQPILAAPAIQRAPANIVFDIACRTLKPTWPGDFTTGDERRARAIGEVLKGTGMSPDQLNASLDPWASTAMRKSIDAPFDLGLALFWLKDYRGAREAAQKEFKVHPPDKLQANEKPYKACLLAAAAAYAAEDVAGAQEQLLLTKTFPHHSEGKGSNEERAQIYRQDQVDNVWHAQRLTFFAQTIGTLDGHNNTWSAKFQNADATALITPEDMLIIMCRRAQELATIGQTRDALAEAGACVQATEKLHGRDSRQAVLALCAQAGIAAGAGDMREAEAVLSRAAQLQGQHFSTDERLKSTVLHAQASAALAAGKVINVDAEAQAAWDLRMKQFGPDSLATLESLSLLGRALRQEGEVEKAMAKFSEVQSNVERLMGKTNLLWLLATRDLAMTRRLKGDLRTAYTELEECSRLRGELVMQDTIEGALTMDCFGVVSRELESGQEALLLHQEALSVLQKMLGSQHPLVARVTMHLGAAQHESNAFGKAEHTLRQALALYEKESTPAPLELAETLYFLGRCLGSQGKDAEGLSFHERGLKLCEKHCYLPSVQHALALHSMARCYASQDRLVEATGLHARAEEILAKCTSEDHWARGRGHLLIGGTFEQEGRKHEAFDRFALSWQNFRRVLGREHQQTILAWRMLCEAAAGAALPKIPYQPEEAEPGENVVSRLRTVRDEMEKSRAQNEFQRGRVGA
jgi:tetratricopeptide (TPR) repeat protein